MGSPKSKLKENCRSRTLYSWMPFLLTKEQHQSSED